MLDPQTATMQKHIRTWYLVFTLIRCSYCGLIALLNDYFVQSCILVMLFPIHRCHHFAKSFFFNRRKVWEFAIRQRKSCWKRFWLCVCFCPKIVTLKGNVLVMPVGTTLGVDHGQDVQESYKSTFNLVTHLRRVFSFKITWQTFDGHGSVCEMISSPNLCEWLLS